MTPTLESRTLTSVAFSKPALMASVRARHKLQVPALQRRYAEWEIVGPPEIRHVTPGPIEHFNPFKAPAPARVCIAPMVLYMR